MYGNSQLLNITGTRRWLATEQPTDESGISLRADLQHPLAVLNLAHDNLKLRRASAAHYRPAAVSPVIHLIGTPPCRNQFSRETAHQSCPCRMVELHVLRKCRFKPEILRGRHGVVEGTNLKLESVVPLRTVVGAASWVIYISFVVRRRSHSLLS